MRHSIPPAHSLRKRSVVAAACALFLFSEPLPTSTQELQVGDNLLRIPAGYLVPWPAEIMRNRVNTKPAIYIRFWMPEKRYLEINPLSSASFRPKEPGRAKPSSNDYVVWVNELRPLSVDQLGYLSPEKQFQNLTSVAGVSSFSFQEENFGLVRFWRHDWPYSHPEPFTNYRHREGSDPLILLRCTPSYQDALNPLCDGYVYFRGDQLSFYIIFSRTDLPRWRESSLAVRDLFKVWSGTRQ
jgi:hypothetical protein